MEQIDHGEHTYRWVSSIYIDVLQERHPACSPHRKVAPDYYLSNTMQPAPPALLLWRSRRHRKHRYAFILENIGILAEPSQPPEPAVVAPSFSGQKERQLRLRKE
jgi:hypothetical protein